MFNNISEILAVLPPDIQGTAKIPSASHLFMTNEEWNVLTEDKVQTFHHLVAKLQYLCRHMKQDVQMEVAFLCTRVNIPDIDYYKDDKGDVVPHGTQDLTLTIEPDDHINWWVDSSYMLHLDMISYSGIYMLKGATYSGSGKQN